MNRPCDEDGCWGTVEPDGPIFSVGHPPGDTTLMRRFVGRGCGHRYFLDLYDNPDAAWSDTDHVSEVPKE